MKRRRGLTSARTGVPIVGTITLLLAGLVSTPAIADSAPLATERTETAYTSTSAVTSVTSSVVRLHIPLPASAGPHPASCDWLSYLRFRSVHGPESSAQADRILIAQPGIFEGAGAFESVARNTVARAASEGNSIEFWALDRRSNCVEDHTGIDAALQSGSFDTAADYYFDNKKLDGATFAGFDSRGPAVDWLRNQGLEQTLRDEYDVMRAELPDQEVRKQKVLCGGHSLGGSITSAFAEWDFDGDPRTTEDAGDNQCAGYFALDTTIGSDLTAATTGTEMPALPQEIGAVMDALTLQVDAALPVLAMPAVINPETMNLLSLLGLAARLSPDGVDEVINQLPHSFNLDATLRTLLSKDYAQFTLGRPDIRTIHATNTAILGAILDDNSQPFGFLQASVGFFSGGPVAPKQFPIPGDVAARVSLGTSMFGDAQQASPTGFDPGTVYHWSDYGQIDPTMSQYTTPASEVTSIHELARNLSEPPLDFTEWYFPTRLPLDLSASSSPETTRHRLYPGAALRSPMITFAAGGGLGVTAPDAPRGQVVALPGYNHLDVLTAAATQNNGQPEQVSMRLAAFAANPG